MAQNLWTPQQRKNKENKIKSGKEKSRSTIVEENLGRDYEVQNPTGKKTNHKGLQRSLKPRIQIAHGKGPRGKKS